MIVLMYGITLIIAIDPTLRDSGLIFKGHHSVSKLLYLRFYQVAQSWYMIQHMII
jgi:hypothetical protein